MSTRELTIREEAAVDVDEAYEWYEQQRPGLGDEFLVELDDSIERIRKHPTGQPRYNPRFHCTLLDRFPYVIYFSVDDSSVIVFGVLHGRRDAQILKNRT